MRSRILATSSAAVLSVSLCGALGSQAIAQDSGQGEAAPQERIVVTGSRIVRQDFTANSPILTVNEDLFQNTSSLTVESVLNQLPQFTQDARSEFRTTSVEPTADQSPGTSQVNLRGLGANRSLVLVDGRRAMPVNAAMAVDTNIVPSSAIERVEIISGGASAVYGADAVGGVVNFILRDNYEGAEFSARYGITEQGDGQSTNISALFGADFADGRGNVMFAGDLSNRSPVLYRDRDWMINNMNNPNIFLASSFGSLAPNFPSYVGTGTRVPGITDRPGGVNGPLGTNQPSQAAVNAIFPGAAPGAIPRTSTFLIDPATGVVFTSSTASSAVGVASALGGYKYNGPFLDENGCPFRSEKYDGTIVENVCYGELASPLDRYSFFGRARYEINEAVEVSLRGNYATTYTRSVLFPAGANMIVPFGNQIFTGNDYAPSSLMPDGVTTNPAYRPGGRYGLNCPATGGCTQSQAFPLPAELVALLNSRGTTPTNANEDFVLAIPLFWGDPRGSSTQNDIFQLELGFEGDLGAVFDWATDWSWDASISHGETHTLNQFTGFASANRFRAVAESPNFGRGFEATGNFNYGGAGGGSATCTSGLPIFRDIEVTEDCIKAYEAVMQNSSYLEQNTLEANLTGDIMELPAGTLQFAVGANYRENLFRFNTDPLNDLANATDLPFGLFPKENAGGSVSVKEIYGELLVPIVSDLPFIDLFSLEIGGRVSDYDPTGQVETYKLLGDWEINDFMRLRGGYNRATRAPNLNELYASRAQTVAGGNNTAGDPCSPANAATVAATDNWSANPARNTNGAAGAAHTQTICRALMARDSAAAGLAPTVGQDNYYNRPLADMPTTLGGGATVTRGNPDVGPESADTYTVGLVVTSPSDNPFLSGFTGSLDYYQIEISDMIAVMAPPALVKDCFSQELNPTQDITKFSCSTFLRDPLDGEGLYIERSYTNLGWAKLAGVDLQVNWRGEFEDLGLSSIPGGAGVNFVATIPTEQLTQSSPTATVYDSIGTQYTDLGVGGGAYDYTTLTTFNYFVGDLDLSLRWEYTPSILADEIVTNPASPKIGVPKGASLFGLSGNYRLNDVLTLRGGVDNLLDTEPPAMGHGTTTGRPYQNLDLVRGLPGFGSSGVGAGAYDVLGRRYYVGFTMSY